MNTTYFPSPVGLLRITASDEAITHLEFAPGISQPVSSTLLLQKTVVQLQEYFAGKRTQFDLPLAPVGTDFHRQVWQALRGIPYGKTASYADIARKLNNPQAVRAVGQANNRNPIAIIIPCHRIIGSNGTLTGYAGGVDKKKWLLGHELQYALIAA